MIHSKDSSAPTSGWGTDIKAGYQFTYDISNNITAIDSYLDGYQSYSYDPENQLTSDGSNSYTYDANGNRTYAWDSIGDNNQLLSIPGNYDYEYDDEGNRLARTDTNTGEHDEYVWDWRNRLISVKHWGPDVEPPEGWGPNSDSSNSSAGLSATTFYPISEGEDVVLGLSTSYPSYITVEYWTENVTATAGSDYTSSCTATSKCTVSFGYWDGASIHFATATDSLNETTESFKVYVRIQGDSGSQFAIEADIKDDDGPSIVQEVDYTYDPFNQLVRRTLDADGDGSGSATDTFYSNLNGQIALQFDGPSASDLSHRYLWNPAAVDQLLAAEQVSSLSSAGSILWPLADQVGTIRDLATHNSSTGATTIANHRVYDAFGNLTSETNSAVDEIFSFTGRLFDEATGLQNNLNRWYDAKTGVWTSEDPIGFAGGDTNRNRYVGNNPLSFTDPNGHESFDMFDGIGNCALDFHYRRNELNGDLPVTEKEAIRLGWTLVPPDESIFHRIGDGNNGNRKYTFMGKFEAVYHRGICPGSA